MANLPSRPLDGRIALVTGGTRGLGNHIAAALLAAGARVAIRAVTASVRAGLPPTLDRKSVV